MSRSENDRIFRSKSGKTFHNDVKHQSGGEAFGPSIAHALKTEYGGGSGAIKRVARLLDANERAVRNWFEGKNGPSGEHLVRLMGRSDAVLETVLELADRRQLRAAMNLAQAREQLSQALAIIEAVGSD